MSSSSSARLRACRREAVQPAEHHQVLAAEEDLVERGGLADQADRATHRPTFAAYVVAGHRGLALLAADQGGERVDGRALAGPVRAEQGMHGAGSDLEVEAVKRHGVAVPLAQSAGDQGWGVEHANLHFPYDVRV